MNNENRTKSCCEVNAPAGGCHCGRLCPARQQRELMPTLILVSASLIVLALTLSLNLPQ